LGGLLQPVGETCIPVEAQAAQFTSVAQTRPLPLTRIDQSSAAYLDNSLTFDGYPCAAAVDHIARAWKTASASIKSRIADPVMHRQKHFQHELQRGSYSSSAAFVLVETACAAGRTAAAAVAVH